MTYAKDLGDVVRRGELKSCIVDIFNKLGLKYSFTTDEEEVLFAKAKLCARRKVARKL